ELMICDLATGESESRSPDPDGQLFGLLQAGYDSRANQPRILVDDAGEWAYVYLQQGGSLRATRIALHGDIRVEPVTGTAQSVIPLALAGTGLRPTRPAHPQPADWVVIAPALPDTASAGEPDLQPVTGLNAGWLGDLPFEVHHLRYPTADGRTEIEGWYLEP